MPATRRRKMNRQLGQLPGFIEEYELELLKARGFPPRVPDAEIEGRIQTLREFMARDGFDAVLIYGAPQEPSWIRYLANYIHPFQIAESFLLIGLDGEPILFIDRDGFLAEAK